MQKLKTSKMSDPVQSAMEHLEKSKGLDCKEFLGKGTYGSVIRVNSQELGVMAAKIVQNKVVNLLEMKEWSKLSHPNVLRLLDTIYSADGVVVFLTELMDTNLFLRLQSKEFKKKHDAIDKCRRYARQVLSGLNYLHRLELCHLDLRAENVFLSSDDRAVVADFSGLCRATDMKKFCPLPHSLRPPEMLGVKKKVAPLPIDLWAYGLLLANLFLGKGFYICTVKHPHAGTLRAAMEYKEFFMCETYVEKFSTQTYPNSKMTVSQIRELISLMKLFLELDPGIRIGTEHVLGNGFLGMSSIEESSSVPSTSGTFGFQMTQESSSDLQQTSEAAESEKPNRNPAPDSAGDKKTKQSTWKKYKSRIKSVFNSPPLFRSDKPKQKQKPIPKKGYSDRASFTQ